MHPIAQMYHDKELKIHRHPEVEVSCTTTIVRIVAVYSDCDQVMVAELECLIHMIICYVIVLLHAGI